MPFSCWAWRRLRSGAAAALKLPKVFTKLPCFPVLPIIMLPVVVGQRAYVCVPSMSCRVLSRLRHVCHVRLLRQCIACIVCVCGHVLVCLYVRVPTRCSRRTLRLGTRFAWKGGCVRAPLLGFPSSGRICCMSLCSALVLAIQNLSCVFAVDVCIVIVLAAAAHASAASLAFFISERGDA